MDIRLMFLSRKVLVPGWMVLLQTLGAMAGTSVTASLLRPDVDSRYQLACVALDCHPIKAGGVIPQHPPYLEGHCMACHLDHASTGTALLKSRDNGQCLQCHTGLTMEEGTKIVKHPPDTKLCLDCHNPHESNIIELVRDRQMLFACGECHEPFLKQSALYPYRHHYFNPQTQCGSCHYAHQREGNHYLRENVAESCLTCHDLPIKIGARTLGNIAEQLLTYPVVHRALEKGSCPTCHTPHGSEQESLLGPGYPAGNYATYQREQYALCWQCHNSALVETPKGEKATAFRNGDKNLHWFHVVNLKRGRACQLCHAAHASKRPFLIREKLRFRKWITELGFELVPDGGSCVTPCHDPRSYSRSPNQPEALPEIDGTFVE